MGQQFVASSSTNWAPVSVGCDVFLPAEGSIREEALVLVSQSRRGQKAPTQKKNSSLSMQEYGSLQWHKRGLI